MLSYVWAALCGLWTCREYDWQHDLWWSGKLQHLGVPELWLMSPSFLHNFITRRTTIPEPPGRSSHIPAVKFDSETISRQPCSDWHDARILLRLLIYPSRQGYSSSANSKSKFMMSANFVSNSANLSSQSKSCQQFSEFVVRKKILLRHVWELVLSAIQQISNFLLKKQTLILLSQCCQQFSKFISCKQILSAI